MSERINESENNAYHSKGATFTGNPRYTGPNEPIEEKPGAITSDSLAAESLNSGGGFASNQTNIAASSQPSAGYTGNTTDTSGATILPPTGGGQRSEEGGSRIEPSGASDVNYTTPRDEAKNTEAAREDGVSTGEYSTSSGGPSYSSGDAPSAYSAAGGDQENLKPKPKGQNISEGGFDADAPNASFNDDVGGKNDPGRVAEQTFAQRTARAGADAGYEGAAVGKDVGQDKGGFERLGDDVDA